MGRRASSKATVATEQHRLALMQLNRAIPDFSLELPTLDGGTSTWRVSYFGPERWRIQSKSAQTSQSQRGSTASNECGTAAGQESPGTTF